MIFSFRTDIVFVLVGNEADYNYALLNNTNQAIRDRLVMDLISYLHCQLLKNDLRFVEAYFSAMI